jgi:hypothetical protein
MTHPRKSVSNNQYSQQIAKGKAEQNCPKQLQESKNCSNEVQPPAGSVGVLRNVEWIELIQIFILFIHRSYI